MARKRMTAKQYAEHQKKMAARQRRIAKWHADLPRKLEEEARHAAEGIFKFGKHTIRGRIHEGDLWFSADDVFSAVGGERRSGWADSWDDYLQYRRAGETPLRDWAYNWTARHHAMLPLDEADSADPIPVVNAIGAWTIADRFQENYIGRKFCKWLRGIVGRHLSAHYGTPIVVPFTVLADGTEPNTPGDSDPDWLTYLDVRNEIRAAKQKGREPNCPAWPTADMIQACPSLLQS